MKERELQLELERIEELERAKEREERLLLRSMSEAERQAYLANKEAAGMNLMYICMCSFWRGSETLLAKIHAGRGSARPYLASTVSTNAACTIISIS